MNMKKNTSLLILGLFCFIISAKAQLPSLSKKEIKQGWMLLFNGKTFDGWQKANGTRFTGEGWKIENGVMGVNPQGGMAVIL
jgi:hypothetical protein